MSPPLTVARTDQSFHVGRGDEISCGRVEGRLQRHSFHSRTFAQTAAEAEKK